MLLKILSPDANIFEWEVEKVIIPTVIGEICVLPDHTPLSSIIVPWIVKILPKNKNKEEFLKGTKFLFEHDNIALSVGKWLLYLDGKHIMLLVWDATTTPISDEEALENMKKEMEKEIEQIKLKWNIEEVDKAFLSLQKITADLQLHKIHKTK